jgi:hypothetical protein
VVLVDVAHVGRGLYADAPRDDDLDIVEPLVRSSPRLAASVRIPDLERLRGGS